MGYSFFISAVSVAILIFTTHLLALRLKERPLYLPLILFFSGLAIILTRPLTVELDPVFQMLMLVCSLPALLVLPPSFWCYVQGLTNTTKWRFSRDHLKHFILPIVGLFIAVSSLMLPSEVLTAVLTDGGEKRLSESSDTLRYFVNSLLIMTFGLILMWVVQSGVYVFLVFKRLTTYRLQLKQVFASTKTKEFAWITWLLVAVGSTWFVLAAYLVFDNLLSSLAFSFEPFRVVLLVMIWSVASWGLRHKPGFEEIYNEQIEAAVFDVSRGAPEKYRKSALSDEQASNIAKRVNALMSEQQAYLDADISLQKLAKLVNTTPNYLSQTLNEKLDTSFFDYINKHRIEAATELLRASDGSVLDIAMTVGFNSKSSFYSAFKKATAMTPSEYRKHTKSK